MKISCRFVPRRTLISFASSLFVAWFDTCLYFHSYLYMYLYSDQYKWNEIIPRSHENLLDFLSIFEEIFSRAHRRLRAEKGAALQIVAIERRRFSLVRAKEPLAHWPEAALSIAMSRRAAPFSVQGSTHWYHLSMRTFPFYHDYCGSLKQQ